MASRLSKTAIVLLVLLRLATGWHFYNEGVKKLEPSFSSAGFLHNAKGPLAPLFKDFVVGPHGTFEVLGRAQQAGKSEDDGKVYDELLARVEGSWRAGLERIGRLGVEDGFAEKADELVKQKLAELDHYLSTESGAIEDLQHEAWRLEKLRAKGDDAPFQREQIEAKEKEVWQAMQPWGRAVSQIEDDFIDSLAELSADFEETPSPSRIRSETSERSTLSYVDFAVKVVVLGSGICLFLGLFTPWAACAAALFLLSVIATQPPWVAGANTMVFFYQLVEVFALLFLAAAGAGRWAGLDGVYYRLAAMNCENSPTEISEAAATDVV